MGVCDQRVFSQLYEAHSEEVFRFLYYKFGNASAAEDMVQEAFVRMWKNCTKVEPQKARGFLFKTANNLMLDHLKHRKVVLKFQQRQDPNQSDVSPDYIMETNEFREQLMKLISDLPESQRTVFLMSRIDKMTYAEIAEYLEISVKAVEKRMHKALKSLKQVVRKI